KQKSSTKLFRERDQSELPVRVETRASTTKIYPSQSGKNSQEVRTPGTIQLRGQQTAIKNSPAQPRAGQTAPFRIMPICNSHGDSFRRSPPSYRKAKRSADFIIHLLKMRCVRVARRARLIWR